MVRKAVVIGAGQTGRGYIARFLEDKKYQITFIDKKKELVSLLKEDGAYCIHFYSKDRSPIYITGFQVCLPYSNEAKKSLMESDIIITSVGEQNLKDVAQQLKDAIDTSKKEYTLLTAENGTNPGKVLRNHLTNLSFQAKYKISMTAVFCSTVQLASTRLDILSMNEWYFPYDCDEITTFDFRGAVPIHNFEKFLERKIFTYNCLAGLISYCGYVKGYEIFGDAANDLEISDIMDRLLIDLNTVLQDYFHITKEDQESFAQRALDKMKNKDILDFTVKNGRAVRRKLGKNERIMAPLRILKGHHKDYRIMEFVAAASLVYWMELQGKHGEEILQMPPIETFCSITDLSSDDPITKDVQHYYTEIINNRKNVNIIRIIYDSRI